MGLHEIGQIQLALRILLILQALSSFNSVAIQLDGDHGCFCFAGQLHGLLEAFNQAIQQVDGGITQHGVVDCHDVQERIGSQLHFQHGSEDILVDHLHVINIFCQIQHSVQQSQLLCIGNTVLQITCGEHILSHNSKGIAVVCISANTVGQIDRLNSCIIHLNIYFLRSPDITQLVFILSYGNFAVLAIDGNQLIIVICLFRRQGVLKRDVSREITRLQDLLLHIRQVVVTRKDVTQCYAGICRLLFHGVGVMITARITAGKEHDQCHDKCQTPLRDGATYFHALTLQFPRCCCTSGNFFTWSFRWIVPYSHWNNAP